MHDESYLKMDYRTLSGPKYYTASKNTPLEDRLIIQKDKVGKMALIWQVISTCGQQSRIFITNESFDATVHLKKCFEMRLLNFTRYHWMSTIIWEDLAKCHYEKSVPKIV